MLLHIQDSIEKAIVGQSKLSNSVLDMEGMSSSHVRHLLNNLCNFETCRYLEIGSWKGCSIISSSYDNKGMFYAVDDFPNSTDHLKL